ncbi:MAG: hypothetical protein Q9167_003357 [Letrouitia subvulpina]
MNSAFLPCRPSRHNVLEPSKPRAVRKTSINRYRNIIPTSSAAAESRASYSDYSRAYELQLRQTREQRNDAQQQWYAAIAEEASFQDGVYRDLQRIIREERNRILIEQQEAIHRLQAQEIATKQARLAAQAERRRAEVEEIRAEAERRQRQEEEAREARQAQLAAQAEQRRVEAEAERRREEEALAAYTAFVVAEAERQREEEEAERHRRERLRECVVCFDARDMDLMTRVECGHWYCRNDLRGNYIGHVWCGFV